MREKSRQTMNGYNGLWTEALFVKVHRASCRTAEKKWERQQNNNKKNQVAIENAKKRQQKKGQVSFKT